MHELALSQSVVDLVAESAARAGAHRVTRVVLEIGAAAVVEPAALQFCFDLAAAQTVAEGAELVIETVPLRARCRGCGGTFVAAALFDACPHCGSHDRAWLAGRELRVKSFDAEP